MRIVGVLGVVAAVAACGPKPKPAEAPVAAAKPFSFMGSHVRSFTDTFAVTALADSATHLWVGTPHGLVRWELGAGRYTVMTKNDGLPADRIAAVAADGTGAVWVATQKGISRGLRGAWQNYPPAPVGDFLTGLVASSDGKTAWAAGPEGLARLRAGKWERYLADTPITALLPGANGVVWVGTSGRGVLRIPRPGDKIEQYGVSEGCEVDVVRALAMTERGLLAVGEGPNGARAALHDGDRFFSYQIESPHVLEWAARAGAQTYLGAGETVFELTVTLPDPKLAQSKTPPPVPSGPVKFTPVPPTGIIHIPRAVALAPELKSTALDPGVPPRTGHVPGVSYMTPPVPRLDTAQAAFTLPEGITAIGGSERGLLAGTRFRGAIRVENGVVRTFRTSDLAAGAERLTVACRTPDDCYLATGGARAWRFDGQSFEPAPIDPEPESRVLAVLRDPKGAVLAIHRGGADSQLRISTVDDGARWTPVSMQGVEVPRGAPDLNFASFSPDGHLWVGLRYVDKDKDAVDYGAAEILLDSGRVIYHRQGTLDPKTTFGFSLPSDMVAMVWKSAKEAWFATRSGAARVLDGKVRVFTENDGMESELIYDIDTGLDDEVWVATRRGTGRFDGRLWRFPKMGPFYLKSTSLGHDAAHHAFIGTEKGLFCVGDCSPEAIDGKRGLLEDAVLDLSVDVRGRVWALMTKGISIVDP